MKEEGENKKNILWEIVVKNVINLIKTSSCASKKLEEFLLD